MVTNTTHEKGLQVNVRVFHHFFKGYPNTADAGFRCSIWACAVLRLMGIGLVDVWALGGIWIFIRRYYVLNRTVRQLLGVRVVRFEELAENISSFFIHTLDISGVVNALANCIFKYIRIRNL